MHCEWWIVFPHPRSLSVFLAPQYLSSPFLFNFYAFYVTIPLNLNLHNNGRVSIHPHVHVPALTPRQTVTCNPIRQPNVRPEDFSQSMKRGTVPKTLRMERTDDTSCQAGLTKSDRRDLPRPELFDGVHTWKRSTSENSRL